MSVTVSDLLNLPSLKHAKVVAGSGGLNKIVSTISVLETVDPSILIDGLFSQGEYFGSEIVITGFINCINDVDCQCANIKRLAEGGEVGLILFYVGIYLPKIDQRLIDLANELDFVLIQMPPYINLRYAEVINDVTEYIYNDRSKNEFIVSDILARVSILPEYLRTINTVLRMVSDGVMSSLILTDASYNVLNISAWPKSMEERLTKNLSDIIACSQYKEVDNEFLSECSIYSFPIIPDNDPPMKLLLIKEGAPLSQRLQAQISDIVRISVNIWGKGHSTIALQELIRAILQDDPIKMNRLADIFRINISEIHEMWILSGTGKNINNIFTEKKDILCDYLKICSDIVFADVYDGDLLIFASTPYSEKDAEIQVDAILNELSDLDPTITLSKFSNLQNTTEVRTSYLYNKDHLSDAKKIFPHHRWFSSGDIQFTKECHTIIDSGESAIAKYTALLDGLSISSDEWDAKETMGVYMLDTNFSITQAAEILHVHKNTVKYRLKVIDNRLGYNHDKMPDSIKMYYAIALYRLLK
ncbi:MAG: PucR family transcriptional regulator ligand-binding domain-containing protein [Firmicutes bacterium]|nr:PucR family transcriptional regulator ligand-binding domain-containing protein [Bacillota bacterium]